MAPKAEQPAVPTTLMLTPMVVGPGDLAAVRRQLEQFSEQLHQVQLQAKVAKPGAAVVPQPSHMLSGLAQTNKLDLRQAADRERLLQLLEAALKAAPVVTMSFAVDPSAAFMAKLVGWLRLNIHPLLLVRIGLQPNIAAGCTLRTTSKLYDFSLRSRFVEQRPLLLERLRGTPAPTAAAATPVEAK